MQIQVNDTANQFRGKIVEIVLGSVVSEIEVETAWGKVASVITTRAVRELGLEIGSEVIAFVKATDVAIAKPRDDRDLA
jgi:molybdopterin-binding protein